MDHTVKIWDAYNNRKCLRTYNGHSEAVRDLCFTPDGSRFVTASYDKWVKVWDTETGQVISRHTTKKIPYCVKVHPDKPDEFLVGQSNKKIVQVWTCARRCAAACVLRAACCLLPDCMCCVTRLGTMRLNSWCVCVGDCGAVGRARE